MSESSTLAGDWDIYFQDLALVSTDGAVRPIWSRQTSVSLTISGPGGVTNRSYEVNHLSGVMSNYDVSTVFFHADQVGSGRMITSVNGYPVWQATFLPFGYEFNPQSGTQNQYKFATYRRDAESGLDFAVFRYYNQQLGRFMSPDPVHGDVLNPQSWNRYAYVMDNPANLMRPTARWAVFATVRHPSSQPTATISACSRSRFRLQPLATR